MKILLNLVGTGLGNNGGSQSIIRMALELSKLNNDVKILLDSVNRFDWFDGFDHLLQYVNNVDEMMWPKCDVIIATGCGTVKSTLYYPYVSIKNKFYWIRGHETWSMCEDDLFKNYKSGLRLLVNSEWLKEMIFRKCNIPSIIQYPGYVDGDSYRLGITYVRGRIDDIRIGILYYDDKPTKRFDQALNIVCRLNNLNKRTRVSLVLFGNKPINNRYMEYFNRISYKYYLKPTYEEKINLMKSCHIWLATTELEGLHIPPIEAGLCGCNLVVKGLYSSGMSDYVIDEFSAKTFLTCEEAVEKTLEYSNNEKERMNHMLNLQTLLVNKIGSVQNNALKFQKILEQSLEK
uniref:Putative glycosyltransferase n=1 Tax=viral metagenome TaxID=1070528 RepID=A0A6M3KI38_9ZZZZ